MKVVFVAPSFFPLLGGVEKHTLNVSQELATDGHQVTVITPLVLNTQRREILSQNIAILRYRAFPFILGNWLSILKYVSIFRTADIVHAHDYVAALTVFPLCKLLRKPLYVTFHGWEGRVPPNRLVVSLRRWLEKNCSGSIVIGEYIRRWYQQKNNVVLYGGIKGSEILPPSAVLKGIRRYLFVGRLEPDTGIKQYFDLFVLLQKRNPNTSFTIVGEGSLRAELERTSVIKNLHCLFMGRQLQVEKYILENDVICTSGYLGIIESIAKRKITVSLFDNPLKEDYLKSSPFSQYIIIGQDISIVANTLLDKIKIQKLSQDISSFDFTGFTWQYITSVYYTLWETRHVTQS